MSKYIVWVEFNDGGLEYNDGLDSMDDVRRCCTDMARQDPACKITIYKKIGTASVDYTVNIDIDEDQEIMDAVVQDHHEDTRL
jgi:hypothetical protein